MYKDYNDYELLDLASEQNEEALNIIYNKYNPLVNKIAKKMLNYCHGTGIELNDLIQEGMLGLNLAIHTFVEDKDTTFYTYARTCIERKMISLIVGATRLKHRFLNESISFELSDEFNESYTNQKCLEDNSYNPENVLVDTETEEELIKNIQDRLTDFEYQVFELKRNGFGYKEIAELLGRDNKAIDNAIQRIRLKIKDILA